MQAGPADGRLLCGLVFFFFSAGILLDHPAWGLRHTEHGRARPHPIAPARVLRGWPDLQAGAYYVGMLAYYWVLATPTIGFLFGCYLYVCVNWFHLHYDEAFSSLRIPHYKGFSRLHITPEGTLHVYSLGMDQVWCSPSPLESASCSGLHAQVQQAWLLFSASSSSSSAGSTLQAQHGPCKCSLACVGRMQHCCPCEDKLLVLSQAARTPDPQTAHCGGSLPPKSGQGALDRPSPCTETCMDNTSVLLDCTCTLPASSAGLHTRISRHNTKAKPSCVLTGAKRVEGGQQMEATQGGWQQAHGQPRSGSSLPLGPCAWQGQVHEGPPGPHRSGGQAGRFCCHSQAQLLRLSPPQGLPLRLRSKLPLGWMQP